MIRFCLGVWLSCLSFVWAQSGSLIGSLRYVDEEPAEGERPLDVVKMVRSLTNAPIVVDASFPLEGSLNAEDLRVYHLVRDGRALAKEGDVEAAKVLYRRALEVSPENTASALALAEAHAASQEYREAERLYLEVLAAEPNNFVVLNNLAWMYATARDLTMRDGEKAEVLSKQALIQRPKNFHVWSTLAEAYYVSGRYEESMDAAAATLRYAEEQNASSDLLAYYVKQNDQARAAHLATSILE